MYTFRMTTEQAKYLDSIDNRSEFIREAIQEKMEREQKIEEYLMKVTIQYYEDEGFARIFVDGNYLADIVRDPNIIEKGIKFTQLKSILVMLDKRTNTDSWDVTDWGMELEYEAESSHTTEG